MKAVFITEVSAVLPNDPVSNNEMESVLGQIGGKPSRARRIVTRSNGIRSRHYAVDPVSGEVTHTNAQLTAEAVEKLQSDDFDLSSLQCLACGTGQADQMIPNHAVMVHGELGKPCCEVIATAGVCGAGMTAMKYAYLGIASGEFTNAIATGSETASTMMRAEMFEQEISANVDALEAQPEIAFEKDFLRWMLSDGAGAVLLEPQPRAKGLSLRIEWMFQRSYANEMETCMYSGAEKMADGKLVGWQQLPPDSWMKNSVFSVKQDVKLLNEHIIHYTVEKPLTEIMASKSLKPEDVDYFLPHYSSHFFRQKVYDGMAKVGFEIPFDRWFTNISTKGNIGSASIYIILEELFHSGRLELGQTILCYVPESGRFSTAFMLLTVCDASQEA